MAYVKRDDWEDATHTLTVKVHHGNHYVSESFRLDLYRMTEGEIRDELRDVFDYCTNHVKGIGAYLTTDDAKLEAGITALLESDDIVPTTHYGWATVTLEEI